MVSSCLNPTKLCEYDKSALHLSMAIDLFSRFGMRIRFPHHLPLCTGQLLTTEPFQEVTFIPNHDTITCYHLNCLLVKCFTQVLYEHSPTFPVFWCLRHNFFETYSWHQIPNMRVHMGMRSTILQRTNKPLVRISKSSHSVLFTFRNSTEFFMFADFSLTDLTEGQTMLCCFCIVQF